MVFNNLVKQAQTLIAENSAALLTGTAVVGTVTTGILAARGGMKAQQIIQETEQHLLPEGVEPAEVDGEELESELTTWSKVALVWPHFVPAVTAGVGTIGSIVFAHKVNASKSAAMAMALTASERSFQEYKDKAMEKLGVKKGETMQSEIAQDRLDNNPPEGKTIIITGGGDVLCYDAYSDRYFSCSMETIRRAEAAVLAEIYNHGAASLSMFYDEVGLPQTPMGLEVGWTPECILKLIVDTHTSPDGRPAIVVQFDNLPMTDYKRGYDD